MDTEFPVGGGSNALEGGAKVQHGYFSEICLSKQENLGLVGGGARERHPRLDPPMVSSSCAYF